MANLTPTSGAGPMWLLAQFATEAPEHLDPAMLWFEWAVGLIASLMTMLYFAFWVWMLIHCYQTDPDRQFWLWILLIVQPIGAIAYFILRYLPSKELPIPRAFRRWRRGREIARLQIAAERIGNAHQFVQWGDALRDVGQLDLAENAYQQALKKDGENLPALWGAAQVAVAQQRFDDASKLSRQVLDRDGQYKFGDVSLVYGKSLRELGEASAAREHFEQHVRRWRHPEAVYLLAQLYLDAGDRAAARQQLLALVQDIDSSPAAIARQYRRWKSKARQMLSKVPG